MFYCMECANTQNWPISIGTSYGRCEVCGNVRTCNDLPSRLLPVREQDNKK